MLSRFRLQRGWRTAVSTRGATSVAWEGRGCRRHEGESSGCRSNHLDVKFFAVHLETDGEAAIAQEVDQTGYSLRPAIDLFQRGRGSKWIRALQTREAQPLVDVG